MSMSAKTGFFDKSTNTSVPVDQSVTGLGFQPKVIIFFHVDTNAHGTYEEHFQYCIGFSVGPNAADNKCLSQRFEDNQLAMDCAKSQEAESANCMNYTAATQSFAGILKTFDSDGFTITWTVNNASAQKIGYLALGGSAITNAFVGTGTVHNAVATKAYTGVGFQPDFVMIMPSGHTSWGNTGLATTMFGIGAASSSTAANNVIWAGNSADTAANTNSAAFLGKAHCYVRMGDGSNTTTSSALLSSFDVDGFTLNWDDADTGTTAIFAYMCLKGGNYDVHNFTFPSGTGNTSKTGLAFKPAGVIFGGGATSDANDDSTNSNQTYAPYFGAIDYNGNQGVVWAGDTQGSAAAVCTKISKTDKCISQSTPNATAGSSTVNYEAEFVSMNSDGYTLNVTTGIANRTTLAIAFGPAPGGGAVDDGGYGADVFNMFPMLISAD